MICLLVSTRSGQRSPSKRMDPISCELQSKQGIARACSDRSAELRLDWFENSLSCRYEKRYYEALSSDVHPSTQRRIKHYPRSQQASTVCLEEAKILAENNPDDGKLRAIRLQSHNRLQNRAVNLSSIGLVSPARQDAGFHTVRWQAQRSELHFRIHTLFLVRCSSM